MIILSKIIGTIIASTIAMASPQVHKGEVYLIQNTVTKSIKIGSTGFRKSPKRLKQLQTGSDAELVLLNTRATKTRADAFKLEAEMQQDMAKHHIRGEWYKKDIK